jgi:glycosyltransferase involved in cell wall biosynthesis
MRVCYFGTYRAGYARNEILMEGLRRNGVEVIVCHMPLWKSAEDRIQAAKGGWFRIEFLWRVMATYLKLIGRYLRIGSFDILVVGYPGHFDVFLAGVLAWVGRKPLVWDVLNSLYLISKERGIDKNHRKTVNLIKFLERAALHLPDILLLDSPEFVAWFGKIYGTRTEKFRLIPIGADDRFFYPVQTARSSEKFTVIYYGTYIPNHGLDTVIGAAKLLEDEETVWFELVGTGPERVRIQELAEREALSNVVFVDWLGKDALVEEIAKADLVLGAFGRSLQLQLTNNNKIIEGFAVRKPVVSARSRAMPKMLVDQEHLFLCEPGDPQALAEAILTLRNSPEFCAQMAENGFQMYQQHFTVRHIGAWFKSHLDELWQEKRLG